MLDAAAASTREPRAASCRTASTTAVVLPVPGGPAHALASLCSHCPTYVVSPEEGGNAVRAKCAAVHHTCASYLLRLIALLRLIWPELLTVYERDILGCQSEADSGTLRAVQPCERHDVFKTTWTQVLPAAAVHSVRPSYLR